MSRVHAGRINSPELYTQLSLLDLGLTPSEQGALVSLSLHPWQQTIYLQTGMTWHTGGVVSINNQSQLTCYNIFCNILALNLRMQTSFKIHFIQGLVNTGGGDRMGATRTMVFVRHCSTISSQTCVVNNYGVLLLHSSVLPQPMRSFPGSPNIELKETTLFNTLH